VLGWTAHAVQHRDYLVVKGLALWIGFFILGVPARIMKNDQTRISRSLKRMEKGNA